MPGIPDNTSPGFMLRDILKDMECRGLVLSREGDWVLVRVTGMNCVECGGCGIFSRRSGQDMEFTARDYAGAQVGDEVIMEIPSRDIILSCLIAFGLPLLAMAVVYGLVVLFFLLAGREIPEGPAVIAAAAAGTLSFWGSVKMAGRRKIHPHVTAILKGSGLA